MSLLKVKNLKMYFPVKHESFSLIRNFTRLTFAATCV